MAPRRPTRARQVRAWGDDAASAGARGHLARHLVRRGPSLGARPARRRGRGDGAAASGCHAAGAARTRRRRAARRARHPRLARTRRARRRRAAAALGGLPRARRPHRGRRGRRRSGRSCSPAPSAPTTGSRRCCCDGSARRACATTTGSCSPSRDRAIDARSRTAATWPPGSPRHPAATCRVGFLSAAEPRLPDAVAAARSDAAADGGRVVVANYLLAPGFFDDLARSGGRRRDGPSAARARRARTARARRHRARPLRRGIRGARLSLADAASARRPLIAPTRHPLTEATLETEPIVHYRVVRRRNPLCRTTTLCDAMRHGVTGHDTQPVGMPRTRLASTGHHDRAECAR